MKPRTTDADPQRPDETVTQQGETQQRVPKMPHERDESAQNQAAGETSGREMGQLAHADVAAGRVDTDKGPALDQAYDKVREGASQPTKQFRR